MPSHRLPVPCRTGGSRKGSRQPGPKDQTETRVALISRAGFDSSPLRTHVRRRVSVPESQSGPVEVQEEGGVMLPQTGHETGGEPGGELEVLVGKEQGSDSGVHTGETKDARLLLPIAQGPTDTL